MEREYVIVGAGIYGSAVAWELARRGADVLVLEADTVASGASGGLGKRGVRANGRDVRELPVMRLAYDLWPSLADEIGAPTGYERIGHLELIESRPDGPREGWASAPARQWLQERHGIPTQLLGRDAVLEMEPGISEHIVGALYCPLDGVADHTATTTGIAQAATRAGAELRERTPVTGLVREGDRVSAVITADGTRVDIGRAVLLLANTAVPDLVRAQLGVSLPVWRMLPQVIATQPVSPMPIQHLIGHSYRTLAMKALPDGRVMISGGWSGRWNHDTGRGETMQEQVVGNVAEAAAVFPALRGVGIAASDASRAESRCVDDIPIIGKLPGVRNLLIGTGWSGHGFAISLAVARLLARWALEDEPPALLRPFSYTRFLSMPEAQE